MSSRRLFTSPKTACLLTACLALGGCVNWSGDVARYREVLDGPDASIQRLDLLPGTALSLTDALAIANADNEAIASAGEDYVQALAEKMRQAGVFLPTLSLGPSYSFTSSDNGSGGTVVTGNSLVTNSDKQFSMTADASANGSLSDLSDIDASKQSVQQQAKLLVDQRETVLLDVAESYFEVLRNEEEARVLEQSTAFQQEKVRDQQARADLGSGRPLDVAQSRADLAATRASLIGARRDAANARSALARLMGVDRVDGVLTDHFEPEAEGQDTQAWIDQAVQQRQDLAAAAARVEAARLSVDSAIRQYFPSVSVNFAYYLYNDPETTRNWTAGISANIPIFSALTIEADIRAAWSAYRQAGLAQAQTRRQVIDEVQQTLTTLDSTLQRLDELQLQVDAAQSAFDLAQRAYELGSGTNLERLTQQDTLLSAQLDLLNERYEYKVAHLQLLRAAGGIASMLPDRDTVEQRLLTAQVNPNATGENGRGL